MGKTKKVFAKTFEECKQTCKVLRKSCEELNRNKQVVWRSREKERKENVLRTEKQERGCQSKPHNEISYSIHNDACAVMAAGFFHNAAFGSFHGANIHVQLLRNFLIA